VNRVIERFGLSAFRFVEKPRSFAYAERFEAFVMLHTLRKLKRIVSHGLLRVSTVKNVDRPIAAAVDYLS
jgi:hypothetical protein